MCLNCGCGEPEARHQATDITSDDIRDAAAGGPLDETVQNMRSSLEKMAQSGSGQGGSMAQSGSGQGGSMAQSGSGQGGS